MFLSRPDILNELEKGGIVCEPLIHENISIASIDLRLDRYVYRVNRPLMNRLFPRLFPLKPINYQLDKNGRIYTSQQNQKYEVIDLAGVDADFILYPGDFVLANTIEEVGSVNLSILCDLADKSTTARWGLSICFNAGFIDNGNVLRPTLEILVNGHQPVRLRHGMHICQVRFAYCRSAATEPYKGKYAGDQTVQVAR
jgi:dCTP deaminase